MNKWSFIIFLCYTNLIFPSKSTNNHVTWVNTVESHYLANSPDLSRIHNLYIQLCKLSTWDEFLSFAEKRTSNEEKVLQYLTENKPSFDNLYLDRKIKVSLHFLKTYHQEIKCLSLRTIHNKNQHMVRLNFISNWRKKTTKIQEEEKNFRNTLQEKLKEPL